MEKKEVPKVAVYVDLPVPSEEVIYQYIDKAANADLVVNNYLQAVQKIAEMEADAIYKTTLARYTLYWKVLAIVCGLVFLITGIFCGYKMKPYFDKWGLLCEPTQAQSK